MLLLDENISHRNVSALSSVFTGIKHIKDFFATGAADSNIWLTAKAQGLTIVTFDSDYEDLVNIKGFPPKVIWLRFGNCPSNVIVNTLLFHKNTITSFIADANSGILQINDAVQ